MVLRAWISFLLVVAQCVYSAEAQADYLDDIGYRALAVMLGAVIPNGVSVRIDQIEAPTGGGTADPIYRADPANADFNGVTFYDQSSGINSLFSGHATSVAILFAGTSSMTPGVQTVDSYETNSWLNRVLFNNGVGLQRPVTGTGILANHSWVGATTNATQAADLLNRLDWLIDVDNSGQIVGVNTNTNSLFSHAYNVIGVATSANLTTQLTAALDSFYVAGRALPHLVAPRGSVSEATPVVTAAVAFLIDSTVANALSVEVIKAVLMAGADRVTRNTAVGNLDHFVGTTANGLDPRYGAGQLNVRQSYTLLAAGERASIEDGGAGGVSSGYDYDNSFGGAPGANATATYPLGTLPQAGKLQATLAWHALIVDDAGIFAPTSRVLQNFNLQIIDTTAGDSAQVALSQSTIDNTETLHVGVLAGRSYSLKVLNAAGNVSRDYAIAWRLETDRDRDGLFDKFETGSCPGVSDADSDDDGLADGAEDVNFDGQVNPTETSPCLIDTDGDGLQDGTERGVASPVLDSDGAGPLLSTEISVFIPDADPTTTTNATNGDTDADGASDGSEDLNHNGALDTGESDPNDAGSTPVTKHTVSILPLRMFCALTVLLWLIGARSVQLTRHRIAGPTPENRLIHRRCRARPVR